jgi:hypothetical protein
MEPMPRPPITRIQVGRLASLLLFLVFGGHVNAQGLLLSSPESASFEFNSLPNTFTITVDVFSLGGLIPPPCPPYSGTFCVPGLIGDPISTTTLPNQGSVAIYFANNLFDPGERLTLDFYENNSSELPVASQSFSGTGESAIAGSVPALWQDRQGLVRLTMNEGSIEVEQINFIVLNEGIGYQGTLPVPEPSTITFLSFVGLFLIGRLLQKSISKQVCHHPSAHMDRDRDQQSKGMSSLRD